MRIRAADEVEKAQAIAMLSREWGEPVIARGRAYRFEDCRIFIAGAFEGVAAVSEAETPVLEMVAINAFRPWQGIGSALIDSIAAFAAEVGHTAIRLTTTNDNLDALRFYQRRGFRLVALRPGAVDEARERKPSIPFSGDYAIPIRDELDLMRTLP